MRLRSYIEGKDFDEIKNWITDERTHAMWCANLIGYPIEKDNFESFMEQIGEKFGDCPFVATTEDDEPVGFFCYSVNIENNEGMLKFVMINPKYRGRGYGKEMLRLANRYAFEITNVDSVQLNVFPENESAKKCYEAVGFVERHLEENAFKYKDESWGRCNMLYKR